MPGHNLMPNLGERLQQEMGKDAYDKMIDAFALEFWGLKSWEEGEEALSKIRDERHTKHLGNDV